MSDPTPPDTEQQLRQVVAELRSLRSTMFRGFVCLAVLIIVLTTGVVYGFDQVVLGCISVVLATLVVLMFSVRPK